MNTVSSSLIPSSSQNLLRQPLAFAPDHLSFSGPPPLLISSPSPHGSGEGDPCIGLSIRHAHEKLGLDLASLEVVDRFPLTSVGVCVLTEVTCTLRDDTKPLLTLLSRFRIHSELCLLIPYEQAAMI